MYDHQPWNKKVYEPPASINTKNTTYQYQSDYKTNYYNPPSRNVSNNYYQSPITKFPIPPQTPTSFVSTLPPTHHVPLTYKKE